MDLQTSYSTLKISDKSTDEQIVSAYKKLAKIYHPDKNLTNPTIANKQMANLNDAYATVTSYRFQNKDENKFHYKKKARPKAKKSSTVERFEKERENKLNELAIDILINKFTSYKDTCNDMLYRYFQYKLYNYSNRSENLNNKRYNEIVGVIQSNYHAIESLKCQTNDEELVEHFSSLKDLLFNFYRQAECSIVYDTYNTNIGIETLHLYQKGDEFLHNAQNEIFFNRHNKGKIDKELVVNNIGMAEKYFRNGLKHYKDSEFEIESRIKFNYTLVLKNYFLLFFFDDE